MPEKKMWMVRAESGGVLFEVFKEKSLVAIGWHPVGDLAKLKNRKTILAKVQKHWPDLKPRQASTAANQLYRFAVELKSGDRVITYDPSRRVYLVGTLASDYRHQPEHVALEGSALDWPNIHDVKWQGEVPRDALSIAAKNSLGAISTLFLLSPDAAADVERVLTGKEPHSKDKPVEDDGDAEEELLKDLQSRALEFIKDRVSALDWEQMQEVVAGLLRAMGYKTRVSPGGPDRGKDIVASPDGFGFESPRIVVEVKHRTQQIGAQDIRSFLGGRHPNDKGLYVSTGGFSKDAHYEAERANIPLTLMTLDDLVTAIIDHYDAMDTEAQRLIPLKRVYWPV